MIIQIVSRYSKLLNIESSYHKPYTLALAYKLVEMQKPRSGKSKQQINHAITYFKKIWCGNQLWGLSKEEIAQYHKFSSLEKLLFLDFEDAKIKAEKVDAAKAEENKKIIDDEANVLHEIIKDNDVKLKKLLSIIHEDIPQSDFLKILASLETDIVLISEQGKSDPSERSGGKTAPSGKRYLDEVLADRGLKMGKLNNAVPFVFLQDITEGKSPIFFDLKAWGSKIEKEANKLREDEGAEKRKFNFALLRTPIHEFHEFGDELGEDSRIKIDDATLSRLNSQNFTVSTLTTIAQILRENKKSSLYEFIDKNLRYLDVVYSKELARNISEHFCKLKEQKEWKISDFIKRVITKGDFTGLDLSDEHIDKILTEAREIYDVIK